MATIGEQFTDYCAAGNVKIERESCSLKKSPNVYEIGVIFSVFSISTVVLLWYTTYCSSVFISLTVLIFLDSFCSRRG